MKWQEAYMNLVDIAAWSFSKVAMKSLGQTTISSYFARGGGYDWWPEAGSFFGTGLCLAQEVDAMACITTKQAHSTIQLSSHCTTRQKLKILKITKQTELAGEMNCMQDSKQEKETNPERKIKRKRKENILRKSKSLTASRLKNQQPQ